MYNIVPLYFTIQNNTWQVSEIYLQNNVQINNNLKLPYRIKQIKLTAIPFLISLLFFTTVYKYKVKIKLKHSGRDGGREGYNW